MPAVASQLSTHLTGEKKKNSGGKGKTPQPHQTSKIYFGLCKFLQDPWRWRWIFNPNPKSGIGWWTQSTVINIFWPLLRRELPPTQYLEFRDSRSSPRSQWYSWHSGGAVHLCMPGALAFLPPLPTYKHTKCQALSQAKMPSSISKLWRYNPISNKRSSRQPPSIVNSPCPCRTIVCSAHERLSINTTVDGQLGGGAPGCLWLDARWAPSPALKMGWDLVQWSKGNWRVGCQGAQARSQGPGFKSRLCHFLLCDLERLLYLHTSICHLKVE